MSDIPGNNKNSAEKKLTQKEIIELKKFALNIRIETMKAFKTLGFGHVGGAFSIVETLAVLYGEIMKYDSKNPNWKLRDKLVCSKGHAGPAVYAALALKGFFPIEDLMTLNLPGTNLPSHCDRNKTCGIDMTTGSLGQGISTAIGLALGEKIQRKKTKTFLILGDGELNEGQVWEGAQFASHYKTDNLIAFCDWNKKQLDGFLEDILNPGDIRHKFESFGWDAVSVNGQDINEIYKAVIRAFSVKDKPHMIVLDTIKGAGYKPVEDMLSNHHITVSEKFGDEAVSFFEAELNRLKLEGVGI